MPLKDVYYLIIIQLKFILLNLVPHQSNLFIRFVLVSPRICVVLFGNFSKFFQQSIEATLKLFEALPAVSSIFWRLVATRANVEMILIVFRITLLSLRVDYP